MLKVIEKSLNLTLDIELRDKKKYRTSPTAIYVGGLSVFILTQANRQNVRGVTSMHIQHAPCAVKYERLRRLFNI